MINETLKYNQRHHGKLYRRHVTIPNLMGKAVSYKTNINIIYGSKPGHIEKYGVQQRLVCSHSHPVFPSQQGP